MKTIAFWTAILALVSVSSCTFTNLVAKGNKSHVLFSSVRPTKAASPRGLVNFKSVIAARSLAPKVKGVRSPHNFRGVRSIAARSTAVPRARDLSASTDIASMTYTVTALDGSMAPITDSIDPTWPYLDLYLDAGTTYRIVVTVALTPSAPGTAVGITQYGDQQDFYVDYGYDSYVDLYVHPTAMPVFEQQVVSSTAKYVQPSVSSTVQSRAVVGTPSPSPKDRVFFSPDGGLFYFNYAAKAVYQWTSLSSLNASTPFISFGSLSGYDFSYNSFTGKNVQPYAVSADPSYPGWFYAVGLDVSASKFFYYTIDTTGGSPVAYEGPDITADLTGATNVVPTGVATDDTGDVFVAYYTYDGSTTVNSSIIDYYYDSLYQYYPQGAASTAAIFTDVTFDQGQLWVLASPVTSSALGGSSFANTGIADILTTDTSLYQSTANQFSVTQVYIGSLPTLPAGKLVIPNRFAGPIQGNLLYLSQFDFFAGTGTDNLTSVDLTTGAVVDY